MAGKRDDERLRELHAGFVGQVRLPLDGFVVGEPVEVIGVGYEGNARRGLTATCRRKGSDFTVGLADVDFPAGSPAALGQAGYREWLGLAPDAPSAKVKGGRHKASEDDLRLDGPVELVVLAVKERGARCRIPGSAREITLRASGLWRIIPGEIVTVRPKKRWSYASHPYLSGEIEQSRLDVAALGLTPLALRDEGSWDPAEEYWGEDDEPLPAWAKPIIARGPRPAFEMEQVFPGADPDDPDSDAIIEALECRDAGDPGKCQKILMGLLAADLRCLDAHAHLGNGAFEHWTKEALRHYEVGVSIGELSLGPEFGGVLPWGFIDNRPFMRCLHGYALCLWRLGRTAEALAVFERMLWLNPSDNQGERFNIAALRAGRSWEDDQAEESGRSLR